MSCYQEISCPRCGTTDIKKSGRNAQGVQRYRCWQAECPTQTFVTLRYARVRLQNLNFRTWIKRLTRKTICFSKSELMHDTVIGLLINKVELKRDTHVKLQV